MGAGEDDEPTGEASADLSAFGPLSGEEDDATAIDLSVDGALTDEELEQLLGEPTAPPPEERTVAEPIPPSLLAHPPAPEGAEDSPFALPPEPDPNATYKLPQTNPGEAEVILPGRSPLASMALLVGGVALFVGAIAAGFVFAPCDRGDTTEDDTTGVAIDGATQDASAITAANVAPDASDAPDARVPDAAVATPADAGRADVGADASADATAGDAGAFVIADPEVPPRIRRLPRRVRARRARAARRVALRLHGRMRYERAEESWRRALVLDPASRFTHQGLARTLRAQGRDAEADAWQARADAGRAMQRRRRPRRRRRR